MARKQEKPEPSVEMKAPASSSGPTTDQSEIGLPHSADGALSAAAGEGGAPGGASVPTASALPEQQEEVAGSGGEPNTEAGGMAAKSDASAVVAGDPAGSDPTDVLAGNAGNDLNQSEAEDQAPANPNPVTLEIYPMRSYMDEGELRRRGGPAYSVPRRHAEELMERKLASLHPLKE